jgi:hypothetical protein
MRCSPCSSTACNHPCVIDGYPSSTQFPQSMPEVMIFCSLQFPPSTGVPIDVSTNTKVGAVDVGMRAIGSDDVTCAKSFQYFRTVFFE